MRTMWFLIAALPGVFAIVGSKDNQTQKIDFAKQVIPIFRAKCFACHSGAGASGSLALDTPTGIQKGGVSGKLWVAGEPAQSLLMKRLKGEDWLPQMPMGFAPLTAIELETISSWIDSGASFSSNSSIHWAYQAPKLPIFPSVKNSKWVRNPIDRLVLSRLEKEGLRPSQVATKETLYRRVFLDLIGIPPLPYMVERFMKDNRPDAYERTVDMLLMNEHYGEKQARWWLDLAHYADTNGFEADRTRTMWPYRDWVINALNKNMPYDRFSIEQIAGDLLPKPNQDQLIATGFYRNAMTNEEGGVDPDEAMYEVINDRVATTSTVWMGSTLQCARCHDHKYDPFTQKDYFQMYAFFGNNKFDRQGDAKVGQSKYYEPFLKVPTIKQSVRLNEISAEIKVLGEKISVQNQGKDAFWKRWTLPNVELPAWVSDWNASFSTNPPVESKVDSGVVELNGANPDQVTYTWKQSVGRLRKVTGMIIEVHPQPSLVNKGPGRSSSGNFILSKLRIKIDSKEHKPDFSLADFEQSGYKVENCFDENTETGWAVSPQYGKPHQLICWFINPIIVKESSKAEIEMEFGSKQWVRHSVGRFWVSLTDHSFPGIQILLPQAVNLRSSGKDKEAADLLSRFDPESYELSVQIGRLEQESAELQTAVPTTLVLSENKPAKELKATIRERGEFLSKGPDVVANTPMFLPTFPSSVPKNRLGLAKWLISLQNPLAARVQVNRMWEQIFGRGLVETVEDFGTQSSPPSNKELLDYLAVKFMKSGWDMKAMYRLIVTSSTYRQSSVATKELIMKDPLNLLLARGPRFRLEAEAIRDVILFASGQLDMTIGGPSVFPPQPEGIWDSPYSDEKWIESKDRQKYRRGLYTFLKRTAAYPSFTAFDATSREECAPRRIRTNTPLQALILMNDPIYLEAAQNLAAMSFRGRGYSSIVQPKLAVEFMFFRATCRKPTVSETERLIKLYEIGKSKPGKGAEFRGLLVVANAILNLDETVTKS